MSQPLTYSKSPISGIPLDDDVPTANLDWSRFPLIITPQEQKAIGCAEQIFRMMNSDTIPSQCAGITREDRTAIIVRIDNDFLQATKNYKKTYKEALNQDQKESEEAESRIKSAKTVGTYIGAGIGMVGFPITIILLSITIPPIGIVAGTVGSGIGGGIAGNKINETSAKSTERVNCCRHRIAWLTKTAEDERLRMENMQEDLSNRKIKLLADQDEYRSKNLILRTAKKELHQISKMQTFFFKDDTDGKTCEI
jgi:hypothetical protein